MSSTRSLAAVGALTAAALCVPVQPAAAALPGCHTLAGGTWAATTDAGTGEPLTSDFVFHRDRTLTLRTAEGVPGHGRWSGGRSFAFDAEHPDTWNGVSGTVFIHEEGTLRCDEFQAAGTTRFVSSTGQEIARIPITTTAVRHR
ncbi:hypothetical protein [Amycolatopsis anabasis]|uniref:hypothetical protein n=1 Tax=Amycolatopsis anabasis TaxID=1840409 RepID=UPI00131ADD1B|nr:hypothetical protein [Amycolatopsis anabasis]